MNKRIQALMLGLALLAPLAGCGGSGDDDGSFTLAGDLEQRGPRTRAALEALPATTQTVAYRSGSGDQTHTYTGASAWSLLEQAGLKLDPGVRNDVLNRVVSVTGTDGYRAVFALGELSPNFGNRQSVVAYAETVDGTSVGLGEDGPFRITSPGDVRGGRYVSNVVRIDVQPTGSTAAAAGGGVSTRFTVSGSVLRPGTYDLAALQALPQVTRTARGDNYGGVDFWTFLNDTVGIATDASAKNPVLGMFVVATGSDGYKAAISLGEIDPGFGNQPNLIAWQLEGAPLTDNGFARLVVPNDVRAGRQVSNLVALEVITAPVR